MQSWRKRGKHVRMCQMSHVNLLYVQTQNPRAIWRMRTCIPRLRHGCICFQLFDFYLHIFFVIFYKNNFDLLIYFSLTITYINFFILHWTAP